MKDIEIRWIDKDLNERIFITEVENANNNFHAMTIALNRLVEQYKEQYLEVENIECVGW